LHKIIALCSLSTTSICFLITTSLPCTIFTGSITVIVLRSKFHA
jgi:hypothetical protein